jgi:hypothetical protein
VDSFDVRWALPSEAFNVGSRLKNRSQVLRLVEGVIKVAFDYGAEVIIEGPAEFEPESAEKMILHSGRVFARVPDSARGFTIQTPYSTVVDLGTEFGVYVADDRIAEVHMFQGKAMLVAGTAGASSRHQITAGQSRAVSQSGQILGKTRLFVIYFHKAACCGEARILILPMYLAEAAVLGTAFGTIRSIRIRANGRKGFIDVRALVQPLSAAMSLLKTCP